MIPAPPAAAASGTARAGLVRLRMPELASLREFLVFAGPGFFALLGKVISYSSMSYAAAAAGTVALAAHQVVVQVFFFFCNIGDAVSNTAQAFLPALWSRGDPRQTRQVIKSVVVVSFILGVLDAGLAMAIPTWLSHIFTGELKVQASMLHVVWHLGASLVLHANVVALEGVLFAAREAAFLARAYAVSTVVFTSAMVAARSLAPSLVTVWWALVLYQVLRLLQFGIKVDAISNVKAR